MSALKQMAEDIRRSPLQRPPVDVWKQHPGATVYVSPHIEEIEKVPFPHTLCITLPAHVEVYPTCRACGKQWGMNMSYIIRSLQKTCPHCRSSI